MTKRQEQINRAARLWNEGMKEARDGKLGKASLLFENALSVTPSKVDKKDFGKWLSATKKAMIGEMKELKKLENKYCR